MAVKFNVLMLMAGIEQRLKNFANSFRLNLDFDLTLKPEKADLFTQVPDNQRASYFRYVSMVFRIRIIDTMNSNSSITYYLFLRNGRDSSGAYTRLSSIELGYIVNRQFKSFFKQHFIGDMTKNQIGMISSLEFKTFEEMKAAARDVRELVCNALETEFKVLFNK